MCTMQPIIFSKNFAKKTNQFSVPPSMDNSRTMSDDGGGMRSMDSMIDPSGTQDNMMDTSNNMMMPQSSGMPPPMSMSIGPSSSSQSPINPSVEITSTSN